MYTAYLAESMAYRRSSHVVLGALSALGYGPVDVLFRGFNIARLAVDATVDETSAQGPDKRVANLRLTKPQWMT